MLCCFLPLRYFLAFLKCTSWEINTFGIKKESYLDTRSRTCSRVSRKKRVRMNIAFSSPMTGHCRVAHRYLAEEQDQFTVSRCRRPPRRPGLLRGRGYIDGGRRTFRRCRQAALLMTERNLFDGQINSLVLTPSVVESEDLSLSVGLPQYAMRIQQYYSQNANFRRRNFADVETSAAFS